MAEERTLFLDEQPLCKVRISAIVYKKKTSIYPQGSHVIGQTVGIYAGVESTYQPEENQANVEIEFTVA